MNIKQISVFVENKPGALYAMTGVLAQNQIDMRALNVAESSDFGVARVIVDDVYKAATVLKEAGYVHNITPVLGVAIPDVPGGLNKVLQVLKSMWSICTLAWAVRIPPTPIWYSGWPTTRRLPPPLRPEASRRWTRRR